MKCLSVDVFLDYLSSPAVWRSPFRTQQLKMLTSFHAGMQDRSFVFV